MKYSEPEITKLLDAEEWNIEERIKENILNFFRVIHLNEEDFIETDIDSRTKESRR